MASKTPIMMISKSNDLQLITLTNYPNALNGQRFPVKVSEGGKVAAPIDDKVLQNRKIFPFSIYLARGV